MIKSRCTNAIQANKNRGETLFSTAFNTLRGGGKISAPHNLAAHTILFIHGHGIAFIASIAKPCFSFSCNKINA